jgi:hypothetical protein
MFVRHNVLWKTFYTLTRLDFYEVYKHSFFLYHFDNNIFNSWLVYIKIETFLYSNECQNVKVSVNVRRILKELHWGLKA